MESKEETVYPIIILGSLFEQHYQLNTIRPKRDESLTLRFTTQLPVINMIIEVEDTKNKNIIFFIKILRYEHVYGSSVFHVKIRDRGLRPCTVGGFHRTFVVEIFVYKYTVLHPCPVDFLHDPNERKLK